jgi:hypothetical protein
MGLVVLPSPADLRPNSTATALLELDKDEVRVVIDRLRAAVALLGTRGPLKSAAKRASAGACQLAG